MHDDTKCRTIYINTGDTVETITAAIEAKCKIAFFGTMYIALNGEIQFQLLEFKERNIFDLWHGHVQIAQQNAQQIAQIIHKFVRIDIPIRYIEQLLLAVKSNIEILTAREFAAKHIGISDENTLDKIEVAYHIFKYDKVNDHFMDDIESVIETFGPEHLCVVADEYNAFLIEI